MPRLQTVFAALLLLSLLFVAACSPSHSPEIQVRLVTPPLPPTVCARKPIPPPVEADDRAATAREVGELQKLEPAADTDVKNGRAPREVAGVDGRAAAIVHVEHPLRHTKLGQPPHRI